MGMNMKKKAAPIQNIPNKYKLRFSCLKYFAMNINPIQIVTTTNIELNIPWIISKASGGPNTNGDIFIHQLANFIFECDIFLSYMLYLVLYEYKSE